MNAATRAVIERLTDVTTFLLDIVEKVADGPVAFRPSIADPREAIAEARKLLDDDALSKPASEDAWLVEAEQLVRGAIKYAEKDGNSNYLTQLRFHLRSRPARDGFVSVPVEQAKDGELFRSLTWRFEEDRDMGPGGRWWVSVSTNDPKIRNDLRKVLIEAAKGDGK